MGQFNFDEPLDPDLKNSRAGKMNAITINRHFCFCEQSMALLIHALFLLAGIQGGSTVAAQQPIQKNDALDSRIELETVIQSGHPGIGELMVFDSSEEYLAVSSRMSLDTTVWHIPTRTMIRRFHSHRTIYDQPKHLQLIENPLAVVLTSSQMVERWNISDGQRMEI
jgi:hypothetical protein